MSDSTTVVMWFVGISSGAAMLLDAAGATFLASVLLATAVSVGCFVAMEELVTPTHTADTLDERYWESRAAEVDDNVTFDWQPVTELPEERFERWDEIDARMEIEHLARQYVRDEIRVETFERRADVAIDEIREYERPISEDVDVVTEGDIR